MQTRTYGDLFKLIQSLAGVGSFAASEQDDVANLINRRYFEAYQTSQMWPRYLVAGEERSIPSNIEVSGASEPNANGTYVPISYLANAWEGPNSHRIFWESDYGGYWKIYDYQSPSDYYVESTYGTPVTTNPWDADFNTGEFSDAGVSVKQVVQPIPYTETNKDNIGEFLRIHKSKPFSRDSALEFEFYVDSNGAHILNISTADSSSAYITYKKQFTPFTTSSSYTTSTEEVPSEFFHFIAHSAYADLLRIDDQIDKALIEEATGKNYLSLELERVDLITNNNNVNKRFSTYVSRQAR